MLSFLSTGVQGVPLYNGPGGPTWTQVAVTGLSVRGENRDTWLTDLDGNGLRDLRVHAHPHAAWTGEALLARGDGHRDGAEDIVIGSRQGGLAVLHQISRPDPCATGNVDVNAGGPYDVLLMAGSAGPPSRAVHVGLGQPFTVGVEPPPTQGSPACCAVWSILGAPVAQASIVLPIGSMCFLPQHLGPATPGLFT